MNYCFLVGVLCRKDEGGRPRVNKAICFCWGGATQKSLAPFEHHREVMMAASADDQL